jgi:hypothetical protein
MDAMREKILPNKSQPTALDARKSVGNRYEESISVQSDGDLDD